MSAAGNLGDWRYYVAKAQKEVLICAKYPGWAEEVNVGDS